MIAAEHFIQPKRKSARCAMSFRQKKPVAAVWLSSCLTLATFAGQLQSWSRSKGLCWSCTGKLENPAGEIEMVIGVLASGFLAGLFGVIAALTAGFPLWAAILLYPILGTVAACGFIAVAVIRREDTVRGDMPEFATEMR